MVVWNGLAWHENRIDTEQSRKESAFTCCAPQLENLTGVTDFSLASAQVLVGESWSCRLRPRGLRSRLPVSQQQHHRRLSARLLSLFPASSPGEGPGRREPRRAPSVSHVMLGTSRKGEASCGRLGEGQQCQPVGQCRPGHSVYLAVAS